MKPAMMRKNKIKYIKNKKIIDSLSSLVNEVNLEATSNGLSLQAMDSAHVSLVALSMKEEGFEEYRCDKNTTLGLNLLDLGKVLKLAKPNDVMTILANEDNSFLTIKFDNESKLFNKFIFFLI